ncbi:hypothetical protein [Nocardiopsis halophila]|uniref:hypothetical protein n=1 Tax=Nocardiopsis halophila TaxID=141692 RepID=UPI00037648FC|nr:hypothetical protein [Nocardiopsis halophila]
MDLALSLPEPLLWGSAVGAVVAAGLIAASLVGFPRGATANVLTLTGSAGGAVAVGIPAQFFLPPRPMLWGDLMVAVLGAAPILLAAGWLRALCGSWRRNCELLLGLTVGTLVLVPAACIYFVTWGGMVGVAPGLVVAAFSAAVIAVNVKRRFARAWIGGAAGFVSGVLLGPIILALASLAFTGLLGGAHLWTEDRLPAPAF